MKVYLETLGCKLNESELEAWTRQFAEQGNEIVADPADADICVLNTCTITHVAARKSRQSARQLARVNPRARMVLTGCYASTAPNEAHVLPNVALVVPNAQKDKLVQMTRELLPVAECTISAIDANVESGQWVVDSALINSPNTDHHPLRTRAFVKIQDGCNMSCTYCIIPLARGKERSRPIAEVVAEAKTLVDSGYKEIILTGVQIADYRHNVIARSVVPRHRPLGQVGDEAISNGRNGDCNASLAMTQGRALGLRDLVSGILSQTNVPRLRLTSIAPWDLDELLLDLFSDVRLCRHLHLSLQSGSDTVLRRMRRPYTTAQFARAVEMARAKIPDVGITTDVIVGFPGESDYEFEQSLEFVQRMQFSRVHVFPYSARAGTMAAGLPLQVADATKEARAKKMHAVADNAARAFASRFIGREMEVLWETKDEGGRMKDERNDSSSLIPHPSVWSGYTDNYIRVIAPSNKDLHNQITLAILNRVLDDGVTAELM